MTRFDNGNVNLPAYYKHNNGDLDIIHILDYDGEGHAWVRWQDDFIDLVNCDRLEIICDE